MNKKIEAYYNILSRKIKSPYETRNKSKDFSQYDIFLVKKLADRSKNLLDLGSGTGLLINSIHNCFKKIVAVEKYKEFSDFIIRKPNIDIINEDITNFKTHEKFDIITIFGVMNFFNAQEAKYVYKKVLSMMHTNGVLIIKNQFGLNDNVVIDGYSEELKSNYYSEYRYIDGEINLLQKIGFNSIEKIDIYPKEYNRWSNTHFYALVCKR
ncbi:methyltransferase [Francisella tularensis subsp. holarctica FSC022]|uniref:class I SAM-dependent methyltransferase n=1 Tax=Francisella tularensis TaxID=263 RepID=UPI0002FA4C4A|nr:class I SAM-dependent methyltransferase [Francisella tularensis]KIP31853.1 methyltransferase domain protein [Francisella tularensis subsp. holarctica]MCC9171557.1 class I SAM-dependent methyltransferase [Francisella tularensis]OPH23539.1 methyltransferase [Francisella tularensis subsp. holarctica FSC022]